MQCPVSITAPRAHLAKSSVAGFLAVTCKVLLTGRVLAAEAEAPAAATVCLELPFGGTGTRGTGAGVSDRGVLGKWQQPIYKDWLLSEPPVRCSTRPGGALARCRGWIRQRAHRIHPAAEPAPGLRPP